MISFRPRTGRCAAFSDSVRSGQAAGLSIFAADTAQHRTRIDGSFFYPPAFSPSPHYGKTARPETLVLRFSVYVNLSMNSFSALTGGTGRAGLPESECKGSNFRANRQILRRIFSGANSCKARKNPPPMQGKCCKTYF